VRIAVIRFAGWLRREYEFPIRVPVYMSPKLVIKTIDGTSGTVSFFAPWDPGVEPFIRIVTGDYRKLKREVGRDDALAFILCSLAHEVVHYRQWVESNSITEHGVVRKARGIIRRYAQSNDRF
jgi:hypothetical protein